MRRLRLENAELERRLREHTLELEIANRELEAFTWSVSHDLRAPLSVVLAFVAMLVSEVGRAGGRAARLAASMSSARRGRCPS